MTNTFMHDLAEAQAIGIAPWDLEDQDLSDPYVTVFFDRYPVTPGHRLFVPNNNNIGAIELCFARALRKGQSLVDSGQCDAFNVGINMGQAAGQTVMYPHVHLILRRVGDCADPVGGVRGVVFGQANYRTASYRNP